MDEPHRPQGVGPSSCRGRKIAQPAFSRALQELSPPPSPQRRWWMGGMSLVERIYASPCFHIGGVAYPGCADPPILASRSPIAGMACPLMCEKPGHVLNRTRGTEQYTRERRPLASACSFRIRKRDTSGHTPRSGRSLRKTSHLSAYTQRQRDTAPSSAPGPLCSAPWENAPTHHRSAGLSCSAFPYLLRPPPFVIVRFCRVRQCSLPEERSGR